MAAQSLGTAYDESQPTHRRLIRVLLGFTGFFSRCLWMVFLTFTEFYRVFSGRMVRWNGVYRAATNSQEVKRGFTGLFSISLDDFPTITEFYRVLPSFTEFYRVLPSF